jgi:hypothetical protein
MALAANRNTVDKGFDPLPHFASIPVADNVHIYSGSLVGLDSAGRARPMAVAATTPVCIGLAEEEVDNTLVGHTAGGKSVRIKCGVFAFDNDTGTAVTNALRGKVCYAKDDYTVSGDSTSRAIAGVVFDVPAAGQPEYGQVFVAIGFAAMSGTDATVFAARLALATNTNGADLVGLYDAASRFTAENVADAMQEALVLGDLYKVTNTNGASTGGFCDVVCAVTDMLGVATGAKKVNVRAMSVTGGTGKNLLAAATSAVGTILSSAYANASAGASLLPMTTGSTGLFSFKVTDSSNEVVRIEITGEGIRTSVFDITISGN